ncbi:agmatine deiminase family protein [Streptomyces omiyaensis]|uniref:agmatine deiminase family protein n=1 Tax=Streptomyces omiyaensis TaxID=68247 RepID=UPI0036F8C226
MDTNFNGRGDKQVHANDAVAAAALLGHHGLPRVRAGFVGEGGSLETDGEGTLLATVSSLVNANRNPGMTQAQVEEAMRAALGIDRVIWVPGLAGQDITDCYTANGAVFVPHFGDADADAAAYAVLAAAYPGRNVVQLDIDDIASGGGIHCATQSQPVVPPPAF